jgi:glycosyltransferase involved in cell wall biosynthesis
MNSQNNLSFFIVAGRTGHSLIEAKALPFAVIEQIKSIYIFSESEGFDIPKCNYITVPGWIRNTRPELAGKIIRFFFEPLQLLYYSLKLKPDFINGVYCLPKGLNSFIVSRLSGVKCVNSVIGSILEIETELPFRNIWRNINLWQLKGCDAITIKGERDKQYLTSNGIDPAKMFHLNGAIDTEKFRNSEFDRSIDILYVGSFIELKGPDRIIRIVKQLIPVFPALKVVLVGEGGLLEKTKKAAKELGITNNISFEGYKKNTVTYFQQSRLLLMPSRSESLPTSMLEAMSCGCVPVISNVGNVAEAAINNVNAKVVEDCMDINGFVEVITDLLLNENIRLEFARKGRKMVEDQYSVESQSRHAEQIISFLNHK